MWNSFFRPQTNPVSSNPEETNLIEIVNKQEHTIKILETQVMYLKDEISLLKIAIIEQRQTLEKSFEDQKDTFVQGIAQILLTLENEKLNNQRLMIELDSTREKYSHLLTENVSLKHRLDTTQ